MWCVCVCVCVGGRGGNEGEGMYETVRRGSHCHAASRGRERAVARLPETGSERQGTVTEVRNKECMPCLSSVHSPLQSLTTPSHPSLPSPSAPSITLSNLLLQIQGTWSRSSRRGFQARGSAGNAGKTCGGAEAEAAGVGERAQREIDCR